MRRGPGLLFIAACLARCWGQSAPATFEVAAIKRATSERGSGSGTSGNIYTAVNLTLVQLIASAYQVKEYQILGATPWMNSERFSITATAPGDPADAGEKQSQMLQALLADRFKLKFHRSTKQFTSYALLVDKDGPKLKDSAPGEKTKVTSGPLGGGLQKGKPAGGYQYTAASMAVFVTRLTADFKRYSGGALVLDKTGLNGSYDFSLPWTPQTAPGGEGPSIFTAIKKLGLRLEKGKYPVEMIAIDSAAKPMID